VNDNSNIQSTVEAWLKQRGIADVSVFNCWYESMQLITVGKDGYMLRAGEPAVGSIHA
jgi:hypothetical protein